jgi:hypothetical protein
MLQTKKTRPSEHKSPTPATCHIEQDGGWCSPVTGDDLHGQVVDHCQHQAAAHNHGQEPVAEQRVRVDIGRLADLSDAQTDILRQPPEHHLVPWEPLGEVHSVFAVGGDLSEHPIPTLSGLGRNDLDHPPRGQAG